MSGHAHTCACFASCPAASLQRCARGGGPWELWTVTHSEYEGRSRADGIANRVFQKHQVLIPKAGYHTHRGFLFALWDTAACLLVSSELDARPLECARSPLGRKPLGFRAVRVPYLQSGSFPSHNPDSCSFSKEESLFWPFDMCSVTYDSS